MRSGKTCSTHRYGRSGSSLFIPRATPPAADARRYLPGCAERSAERSANHHPTWRNALFVQPDRREVLVEEVARTDFPALDVGTVRNDAVPPDEVKRVRLVVEHAFFELPHQ